MGEKIIKVITLSLSIFAFPLSVINAYYNFYYENYDLSAVVVHVDPTQSTLHVRVAFINNGNKNVVISNADVAFITPPQNIKGYYARKSDLSGAINVQPQNVVIKDIVFDFIGQNMPQIISNKIAKESKTSVVTTRNHIQVVLTYEVLDVKNTRGHIKYIDSEPINIYINENRWEGWNHSWGSTKLL